MLKVWNLSLNSINMLVVEVGESCIFHLNLDLGTSLLVQ